MVELKRESKEQETMIRIIDNKKIDLTSDEFALYKQICDSYTKPDLDGEYLFQDLFETDDYGRIIFLKPPKSYTSMEIFMFLMGVMVHQHLGAAVKENFEVMAEMKQVMAECKKIMNEMKGNKND